MYGSVVTEGSSMRGMQKAGGAYGPDNATTSTAYMVNATGSTISITTINVTMTHNNKSIRYWKRTAGMVDYWDGGSSTSSSS